MTPKKIVFRPKPDLVERIDGLIKLFESAGLKTSRASIVAALVKEGLPILEGKASLFDQAAHTKFTRIGG